jgi:hypothetical protein
MALDRANKERGESGGRDKKLKERAKQTTGEREKTGERIKQ